MVLRSNNNANDNGGVAYSNANNASSNTNANIGSRLANRIECAIIFKATITSMSGFTIFLSKLSLTTLSEIMKEVKDCSIGQRCLVGSYEVLEEDRPERLKDFYEKKINS